MPRFLRYVAAHFFAHDANTDETECGLLKHTVSLQLIRRCYGGGVWRDKGCRRPLKRLIAFVVVGVLSLASVQPKWNADQTKVFTKTVRQIPQIAFWNLVGPR